MAQNQFLQSPFDALAPQTDTSIYTLPSLPGSEPVKPQEVPDVTRAAPAQATQPVAEPEPVKAPPRRQAATSNLLPPAQYAPIFEAAAREFDVPVNVLMALGHQESRYNTAAIGQTTQWGRAKGMMQYLDSTASGLGINPFAAEESIPAAARQIRERLDKGYSMEDAVKEHFAGPNRKLWGAKTAAYGREVMEKVGRIGELLGTGVAPTAATDPLADLNKNEPGRYRVATPEEVAAFEKRQSAGLTVTPTNNAEQQKAADERGFFDRAGDAVSSGYDNMVQSLNTAKFVIGGGDSLELARALSDKFAEQQKTQRTTGQKEMDAAFKEVSDAEGVVDTTVKGAKAIYTAITNPKDLAIDAIEQLPNMLPTMGAGVAGAGGGAVAGAGVGAVAGGVGAAPGAIAGAIWGGRAGMLAGTAATELGAEVEYMIGQQLAESRRAPTPENIKSILDSPGFIAAARDQGLKKGLTVAVIDQLFLGLGGKVAGKAGKAATVGGKAAYGAGAVALDATGEVVGEAASQKVARGEVDAGDALKEGVIGLGQSVVEPAVGAGMQAAKKAGQAMRPTAPAPRVEPTVPPVASAPVAPGSQAPSEPVATAAPSPSGPLTGAVEKAAGTTEQPPRVSVVAPEGEVTGFMQSMREDGQGGFTARVLGDDGQVYTFTSADGVSITPLAPEPAGPLTAAVEKVAEQAPSTPAQAPSVSEAAPNITAEGVALAPAVQDAQEAKGAEIKAAFDSLSGRGTTDDLYNKAFDALKAGKSTISGVKDPILSRAKAAFDAGLIGSPQDIRAFEQNGYPEVQPAPQAAPSLTDMTEPELRERLKYIASQGKANGWNKMLTNARREVEREINRRAEGATTDARPDAAVAGVRDEAAGGVQADAPAGVDQPAGRDGAAQLRDVGSADTGAPVPQDGASVPAASDAADGQPALTKKQSAALDRIAKGTAYFGSQEKAEAFIAKNDIGDTHEVVQTGKVRFDVKAKAPATAEESSTVQNADTAAVKESLTVQAEAAPAIIPAGGTTTADEREPEQAESQSVRDFLDGKRPDAPTLEEVAAENKPAAEQAPAQAEPLLSASPENNAAERAWEAAQPEDRRKLLADAGYKDADQARALSGSGWSDLPDSARGRLAQAQPADSATTVTQSAAPSVESSAQAADQTASPTSLVDALYARIVADGMPADNNALRKLVSEIDGLQADNARLKAAQEALEAAIVRRARDIVAEGGDVRQTYGKLVDLYQSQPNLNVRTSTSIENQAYSTPAPLAYVSAKLAGIDANTTVYEPTAGNGMLLITADPKNATANELEDTRFENLKAQGFDAIQGDALDVVSSGAVAAGSQDAVITNPPFGSVKDENGKATKVSVDGYKIGKIDHLIAAEALKAMKDGGKATLIIGADKAAGGVSTDDRIFFNWLYGNYNVTSHFEVDGKLYSRQGASWPVRVITVDGRRKSSNVSPRPGEVQRVGTWEEVYEQYQQGLDSQVADDRGAAVGADGAVQRDRADDAGTASQPAGAEARRDGAAKPRARKDGAGDVAGERAGAVRTGDAGAAERVAGAAGAQRGDGAPAVADRLADGAAEDRPAGGKARADRPARDAGADRVENQFQASYVPRSSRKDEGVLIPVNMAQPTQDALNALEDEVGDIDEYAMRELGYPSKAALHDALMGLQVDSVASAIYQMGKGKGVIIADQTGIGKGRQAASIIRWAKRKGFVPVFVTVKPQLFTDMFNDLADIGSDDIAPFIMNTDEWIANAAGEKLFANKKSTHRKTLGDIAATGELPEGRNALFLTYSQINTENIQRTVLSSLAGKAIFILDESHNAGGQSQTGEYVRGLLGEAAGVTYLSATYAKRPDNMPVYFKTDIGMAISDDGQLMGAMAAGGLPLQTVVSNNLVKAGQMFRRERSYDGVSISTIVATERRAEHEKLSDAVTEALRGIVDADRAFHNGFVEQMAQQLAMEGAALKDIAGNQASQSVNHTEFSSVVHNFVRQFLLGLKADAAADRAIEAIKAGEKPLIAVENTMGSFLAEYAAAGNIRPGQPLGNFDYRTVLSRALERSRVIVIKDPTGNDTKRRIELSELDPVTRDAYDRAQAVIDGLELDIPVSPIDWMRNRIQQAGYTVAEITGRNLTVDYSEGAPKLSQLPTDEQNDKVGTTRKFNDGRLDAIILNVSGSTGISLHASEKFKDQRPRRMVVAQAAQDINIFMQMLGRIHRTGQVKLPSYEILSVDLPAEKRPTSILSNKMKSLNANTSSNTESATSIKSSDLLNKYGDQVVGAYLADNMELSLALGIGEPTDSGGKAAEDLARKATGRLALMPVEVQKAFYAEVEEQYNNLIDYLNKTNQNELEPRTFDFDARETASQIIFEGENPSSPFGSDAIYHEYSIKAQGKPMTPDEIRAEIAESLDGKDAKQHAADIVAGLDAQFGTFTARLTTDDQMAAANAARRRAGEFIRDHRIGSGWRVEINGDVYNAVVTGIRSTHKGAGNPFSMSKIQVTVALNGALRNVTVPATQFEGIEVAGLGAAPSINALFESAPKDERQTAKIITGNLLAAYGEISTEGTIINFTKADGSTEQGILLPKAFNPAVNTRGDYRIRTVADALKFLRESEDANIARFGIANREGTVRVVPEGSGVALVVPKSKAKGGKFFLNKKITDITGDFVSQGQTMRVTVPASKAADAVAVIMDMNALYALPSMAAEAKKIVGEGETRYSVAYHGTPYRGIDKFSTDNIGTGEGAQAYGWGLYFASKREIAEWYRETLTRQNLGEEVSDRRHRELEEMAGSELTDGEASALNRLLDENPDSDFFDMLDQAVKEARANEGQLYEVEIPEDDVMLLWDKPLSEQSEKVREALKGTDYELGPSEQDVERRADEMIDADAADWADENDGDPVDFSNNADRDAYIDRARDEMGGIDSSMTGKDLYRMIMRDAGYRPQLADETDYQKDASTTLLEFGIKGIKYLDGTSRGAGDGSYNYVIFSGDDVAIQNTFYSMGRGGSLTEPALRESLTTGVIGPVVSRLIDAGAVVLHQDVSTLPAGVKKMRGIQAATTPDGKIHIVAEGVTAENARGVLLHESFHEGGENLIGTEQWGKLMGRLSSLQKQGQQSNGKAREFFDKARARVQAAEQRGAVTEGFAPEEFGAYAIEEYENAPGAVRKWVDDFIGAVKAWLLKRFGKQLGQVTPAQLSAIAKMALMDAAAERMTGRPSMLSVRGDTIEVDGKTRPTTNSNGKPIATTEEGLRNFWRWFGDSKVVDAEGRPLVVYHGTDSVFTEFSQTSDVGYHFGTEIAARDRAARVGGAGILVEPVTLNQVDKDSLSALNGEIGGSLADDLYALLLRKLDSPRMDLRKEIGAMTVNDILEAKAEYLEQPDSPRFSDRVKRAKAGEGFRVEVNGETISSHRTVREANARAARLREQSAKPMALYLSINNPIRLPDLGVWPAQEIAKEAGFNKAEMGRVADADSVAEQYAEVRTILEAKGFDGIVYRNEVEHAGEDSYIAFRPEQIKSATGNRGTFDPTNPDIRYSVSPEEPGAFSEENEYQNLTPDEQGLFRRVQAALQDNLNRLKEVQDRIKQMTGRGDLQFSDYYRAETNRPGRIAARLEEGKKTLFQPLMERLAKSGKTQQQLEELLHAMHAQERNDKIAEINPDMPDGGSGMSNADAEAILDKYAGDTELLEIAKQAQAIAKETLRMKLAYGLIDDETFDTLSTFYENYVPLKGEGEYGPKIKRAMGHEGREERILDNIARDYDQAIVVGEKNLARHSLLQLVLEFRDPELWTVRVPPRGRRVAGQVFYAKKGGKTVATFDSLAQATAYAEGAGGAVEITSSGGEAIREYVKPLQDNEVMVYIKGQPVRIQINDTTLAAQVRPLDRARMNPVLEFMRSIIQYLSKIYTGYNPAFIIRNMIRDGLTGTVNIAGTQGLNVTRKAWANYPRALAAIGKWAATGKEVDTETGRMLREYRMHGGKTGASWMSDLEQQGKTLARMYEDAYGATGYLRDGRKGKAAWVAGRKTVSAMAHVVEVGNQATENALRLALYMTLREQGVPASKAAQAAKSVTVDFDRKGTLTPALGAIYLFINPAIQGTANAFTTLAKGKHKKQAIALLGGLTALGLYAASAGMGDDPDRWLGEDWGTRSKWFLMNVGGHQIRVPISYEFAPAYGLGVAIGEGLNGEKPQRAATRIVSSFIDAYFPLQGVYRPDSDAPMLDVAMAAVPTVIKPATEIAVNRNFFGGQVVPENQFTKDRPDNLKMYRATKGTPFDAAAQGIAGFGEMLGAGRYENDITKVSPETLKMLWRTYTGGLGQFVTDSINVAGMTATDASTVEPNDVPIVKDFVRNQDVKPIRSRYYDNTRRIRAAISEYEQAKKLEDDEAEDEILKDKEKAFMIELGDYIRGVNEDVAEIRDDEVLVNADKNISLKEKRAKLKELERQEEKIYREALEEFKQ